MGTGLGRGVRALVVGLIFLLLGSFANIGGALALSLVEQAFINEYAKLRPQDAKKLAKKLNDIENSKKSDKQKSAARRLAMRKEAAKSRVGKRIADKIGTPKQKADAATTQELLSSFSNVTNGQTDLGIFTPESVKKEFRRLTKAEQKRKEAERRKQEEKKKQAGSSTSSTSAFTDTPFAITMGGQAGRMHRSSVSFLRLELGGNVVDPRFAQINRNDQIAGLNFNMQVNFDERPIMGKMVGLSPFFGVNTNYANSHANFPNLSAMGNQLGILGVEGPTGPLGGGLITGAGFGDLTNGQYREYYDETILFFGVKGNVNLDNTYGEGIKPSLVLHGAFMYGTTKERSYFGGTTNNGTVNFRYNNKIESDRFGLELGMKYKWPINEGFGLYANGAVRFIHNKASGYTMLDSDLNGVAFPNEFQSLSKTKLDVGGIVGAGLFADAGPITGYAGVEGELWQVPVLRVTGTERARVEFKDRTSWTVKIGLRVDF